MAGRSSSSLAELDHLERNCTAAMATGDKGQRYEIRAVRRGETEEHAIAWCDKNPEATAASLRQWPYLRRESVRVVDRQETT